MFQRLRSNFQLPNTLIKIHRVNGADEELCAEVLALLNSAIAYMHDRIDPPSSLHSLDTAALAAKSKDEAMFVAELDGSLCGCVFARPDSDFLYLGKLAAAAEFRGQGVAGALVQRVEQLAIDKGVVFVDLEVRVELVENSFQAYGVSEDC